MPDTPPLHEQVQDIDTILQRVQRGDTTVLPALRALLQQRPEIAAVLGDMTFNVQGMMLSKLVENNQGMRLCIETTMQEMHKTLAGAQPSALDSLLIERLLLDWLYLHLLELSELSQHGRERTVIQGYVRDTCLCLMRHKHVSRTYPIQAESMAKRMDRAHRRYHRNIW